MLLRRKRTARPEPVGLRVIAKALSYRVGRPVVKVRQYSWGEVYPVCPQCGRSLDREYMSFCNCCGQKLSWALFHWAARERERTRDIS